MGIVASGCMIEMEPNLPVLLPLLCAQLDPKNVQVPELR